MKTTNATPANNHLAVGGGHPLLHAEKIASIDSNAGLKFLDGILNRSNFDWTTNKTFLVSVLTYFQKDPKYYVPSEVSQAELKDVIQKWNNRTAIASEKISLENFQVLGGRVPTLQFWDALNKIDAHSAAQHPVSLLPFTFGRALIPTSVFSDKHFQSWVTKMVDQKRDPLFVARLSDGKVSKNDLDWIIDRYKKRFPVNSLINIKNSDYLGAKPTKNIFPNIKLIRNYPTLPDKLIPVAIFFSTHGQGIDKSSFDNTQFRLIDNIQRAILQKPLSRLARNEVISAVAELAPCMKGDSPIAQLRAQQLRTAAHDNTVLRGLVYHAQAEGKTTFAGKPINDVLARLDRRDKQLFDEHHKLPAGTGSYRVSKSKFITELKADGGLTATDATAALLQEFDRRVISSASDGFWQKHPHLRTIKNQSTDPKKLFAEMKGTEWQQDPGLARLHAHTAAAIAFTDDFAKQQWGYISRQQYSTADMVQSGNADFEYQSKKGKYLTTDKILAERNQLADSAEKLEKKWVRNAEILNKVLLGAMQVGASAAAVGTGQLESLPLIWGAPLGLSSLTRAYVEDIPVVDAAFKQFKIDPLFCSPGSVLAEHLGNEKGIGWKLFLLDTVAFAGLDAGIIKGMKTLKGFHFNPADLASIQTIAQSRVGRTLSYTEVRELEQGIHRAIRTGTVAEILNLSKTNLAHLSGISEELLHLMQERQKTLIVHSRSVAAGEPKGLGKIINRFKKPTEPKIPEIVHSSSKVESTIPRQPVSAQLTSKEYPFDSQLIPLHDGEVITIGGTWSQAHVVKEPGQIVITVKGVLKDQITIDGKWGPNTCHIKAGQTFSLMEKKYFFDGKSIIACSPPSPFAAFLNDVSDEVLKSPRAHQTHYRPEPFNAKDIHDVVRRNSLSTIRVEKSVELKVFPFQSLEVTPLELGNVYYSCEGQKVHGPFSVQPGGRFSVGNQAFIFNGREVVKVSDSAVCFPLGTRNLNVKQGRIGNCFFLAALHNVSLSEHGAQLIDKMISLSPGFTNPKKLGRYDSYGVRSQLSLINDEYAVVRFPEQPNHPIKVTGSELYAWRAKIESKKGFLFSHPTLAQGEFNGEDGLGIQILELAYDKYLQQFPHGDHNAGREVTSSYGGSSACALQTLTGTNTRIVNSIRALNDTAGSEYFTASVRKGMKEQTRHFAVPLIEDHAYSIRIHPNQGKVFIWNPWDTTVCRQMSVHDFNRYFELMYGSEASSK